MSEIKPYANLSGANFGFANLNKATLRGANLSCADLSYTDLSRVDLSDANLRGANLSRVDLSDANLRGANLSYANLRGANLSGTNLTAADLREANLGDTNLSYANLRGTNLSGVKHSGTIGDGVSIVSVCLKPWNISMTKCSIDIGCQSHKPEEWWEFSDDEIRAMEIRALSWWRTWKPIVKAIYEAHFGTR